MTRNFSDRVCKRETLQEAYGLAKKNNGAPGIDGVTFEALEADFQPGSFGCRPGRTAHEAVQRVAEAIVKSKTRVIDIDRRAYFDNVRHDRLLAKVARRVSDADVLHLLKRMPRRPVRKACPRAVGFPLGSAIATSRR